jgi:hypothetical protein
MNPKEYLDLAADAELRAKTAKRRLMRKPGMRSLRLGNTRL